MVFSLVSLLKVFGLATLCLPPLINAYSSIEDPAVIPINTLQGSEADEVIVA